MANESPVSMAVTVAMSVAVSMVLPVRMRVAGGADSSFLLQLLDPASMKAPRVPSSGLNAGMGQQFDNSLEVLLGSLGRSGDSDDDGLVSHASHRPRHHCDSEKVSKKNIVQSRGSLTRGHAERSSQHAMYKARRVLVDQRRNSLPTVSEEGADIIGNR